jgi:S-formylglutathione hydrolase FrmB
VRRLISILVLVAAGYLVLSATAFAPVDTHGTRVVHLTVQSRAVSEDLGVSVVIPRNPAQRGERPLLVFLHGRGGSDHTFTGDEAMFKALSALGRRAPVVAFPDGGDHSYWHDRADGRWGAYVMREAIPAVVRRAGIDPHRIAIGGISMGGFGAYDLALLHPGRFCAVGGHSPALWLRGADTAAGAFDDAEDFSRNDVIKRVRRNPGAFGDIPIWNDAGNEDPFLSADRTFDAALRAGGARLTVKSWPGGHTRSYWDAHWGAYFSFYANALAHCA